MKETLATALIEANELGITTEELGIERGDTDLDKIAAALIEAFSYRDESVADYWAGNLFHILGRELGV